MNNTLKSALIELKSEGIALDPIADLDHILALHNLSLEMLSLRDAPSESFIFRPVLRIGNVTLRRLSIGARRFLLDEVFDWYPGDALKQDLAYAYTMAVSDTPEKLWEVQGNRREFEKRVKAWEKTVGVSFPALRQAIAAFQQGEQPAGAALIRAGDYRAALGILDKWRKLPDGYKAGCEAALIAQAAEDATNPAGYGRMIDILAREYPGIKKTPEDWLWRTAETEIETLLAARNERLDAEERAVSKIQDTRMLRAHKAFCDYKDLIRRIKKASP